MSNSVVAIDGPAASGKSTISRKLAERLGWLYVDSGAVYRGLTWRLLEDGWQGGDWPDDPQKWLARIDIAFFVANGAVRFRIRQKTLDQELRSESVRNHVSALAAVPAVRAWVVARLRELVAFGNLVMEGRDIGSVVFPAAAYKFYLDADPGERARRRHLELLQTEGQSDLHNVLTALDRRDALDRARNTGPLVVAADARRIDSTGRSVEEVVAMLADLIRWPGKEQ